MGKSQIILVQCRISECLCILLIALQPGKRGAHTAVAVDHALGQLLKFQQTGIYSQLCIFRIGIILYITIAIPDFLYLAKQIVRRFLAAHTLCLCLKQKLVFIRNLILLRLLEFQKFVACFFALPLGYRCIVFLSCTGGECTLKPFFCLRDQLLFQKCKFPVLVLDHGIFDAVKIFQFQQFLFQIGISARHFLQNTHTQRIFCLSENRSVI